jgi:hypothetical protein
MPRRITLPSPHSVTHLVTQWASWLNKAEFPVSWICIRSLNILKINKLSRIYITIYLEQFIFDLPYTKDYLNINAFIFVTLASGYAKNKSYLCKQSSRIFGHPCSVPGPLSPPRGQGHRHQLRYFPVSLHPTQALYSHPFIYRQSCNLLDTDDTTKYVNTSTYIQLTRIIYLSRNWVRVPTLFLAVLRRRSH